MFLQLICIVNISCFVLCILQMIPFHIKYFANAFILKLQIM